jgi:hypothetical protein
MLCLLFTYDDVSVLGGRSMLSKGQQSRTYARYSDSATVIKHIFKKVWLKHILTLHKIPREIIGFLLL